MPWQLDHWFDHPATVLAVAARVAGFVVPAPQIGSSGGLSQRLLLALLLFVLLLPSAGSYQPTGSSDSDAARLLWQLAAGFMMGFAVRAVFVGARGAASLIEQQMGLLCPLEPTGQPSGTALEQLYQLTTWAILLTLGVHRVVVDGLLDCSGASPGSVDAQELIGALARQLTLGCGLALQLAAPVLAALLASRIVVAWLGRLFPSVPGPSLSAPLQVAVGLVLLLGSVAMLRPAVQTLCLTL